MRIEDFTEEKAGRIVKMRQGYIAFAPNDLPPRLEISWPLARRMSEADRALSELAGVARTIPNPHLFIRSFARREAVLSSRIEGTRASLSDLFFFEAAGEGAAPNSDVIEVVNYIKALNYGLERLKEFPLSLRLIREMHKLLMDGARGEHLTPGEFRRSQNWIGPPGCTLMGATYVPPPVEEMKESLGRLEKYLYVESELPPLIRLALVHYQFEAIHPFLDGNGRIGRLLITLLLVHEGLLPQPLLYLSAFFEHYREEYYSLLLAVSQRGNWTEWIDFFLRGIALQAKDGVRRAHKLHNLWASYRQRLQKARQPGSALYLIDELIALPVTTYRIAEGLLNVTPRAARQNVDKLVEVGILREVTQRRRYKIFVASEIISLLDERVAE